jgi:hypothetical protein
MVCVKGREGLWEGGGVRGFAWDPCERTKKSSERLRSHGRHAKRG